jgi:hypothetical protein
MPTNNQTNQQICHTERSRSATIQQFNNSTVKQFTPLPVKRKTTLFTILLTAALLLALFLWRGGHWLIVETPLQPADAIVVLMGSSPERELEAADLYNAGLADKLLMVEFPSHSNLLLDSFNIDMPRGLSNTVSVLNQLHVPTTSIHILPGDVSSTRGEAIAVGQYLQSQGLHPSSVRAKNFSPQRRTHPEAKQLQRLPAQRLVPPQGKRPGGGV